MWRHVERIMGPIFDLVQGMNRQEWIILFGAAVIVGFFCLRGFGSRANY